MTTTEAADATSSHATTEAAAPRSPPQRPLRAAYARSLPPDLVQETAERLEKVRKEGLETYAEWTHPDPVDFLGALAAVAIDLDACAEVLREAEEDGAEGEEAPLTIQAYAAGLLAAQAEELARRVRAVAAWKPSPRQPYPPTSGAGECGELRIPVTLSGGASFLLERAVRPNGDAEGAGLPMLADVSAAQGEAGTGEGDGE